jgi:hypothetical protein
MEFMNYSRHLRIVDVYLVRGIFTILVRDFMMFRGLDQDPVEA